MWWEPDQDAVRARDRGPFLAASGSDPGKPRRQAGAGVRATECAASTSVDASHLLPCFGATGAPEAKARSLAGLKGYLTNLAACPDGTPVTAEFVIGAYHRLFEIEKSFRMSKHDLQAGPIYHHKRDSIEPHLRSMCAPSRSAAGSNTPSAGRSRSSSAPPAAAAPSRSRASGSSAAPLARRWCAVR